MGTILFILFILFLLAVVGGLWCLTLPFKFVKGVTRTTKAVKEGKPNTCNPSVADYVHRYIHNSRKVN